ncbi:MAG: DUF3300 domain-containing protein [Tateyamaria sp.]|uniref:DUF3300 domain-containing protein n=1 Tax=Tateyamaria sp. TaxID=1929288 RepID=UPI00329CD150
MHNLWTSTALLLSIAFSLLTPAIAQQADSASAETVAEDETQVAAEELLSSDQLDELVAPVALFPDTLLIQVLVASTYPLEVMKAKQWLEDNEGFTQDDISAGVQQQDWDPSIQVLTEAFPDVLTRMADNIDWTELAGSAMLAQTDDVMAAVQRMREAAIDAGSLDDTPEQVVTRDETDAVTILPADPEVIYVPQYKTETVYVSDANNNNNDALVFFGSAILIAAIIDNNNNNYWNGYWGCRNCGGWNGRPIHYRGGDIDINGNVNIGNGIKVGNKWKPDDDRRKRGQDQIRDRKERNGLQNRPGDRPSTLPAMNDRPSRGDQLRRDLGAQTGARDISRPENRDAARQISRDLPGNVGTTQRPKNTGVNKRPAAPNNKAIAPAKAKARPSSKPSVAAPQQRKKAAPSGVKRHQSGNMARKSSSRGGGHRAGGGGRGRR